MRKFIITILTLFIILIIANFSLWFIHTRTITSSVEALKKHMALKGMEFKYKEVKFTNFLAWDAKAVIEKASLKFGHPKSYYLNKFERIDIRSNPFQNNLKITFPKQIQTLINTSSYQRELLIKFKGDKLPYLRLKLFDSLAKFKDDLDDSKFNTHIKEIFYLGDKIEAYDKTNGNQLYYTADLLSLWVVNKNENNSFSSGIIFTLPNLKYNPNYVIENTELQNRYLSTVQFGEISFDINLLIEESKQLVKEEGKKNKASYIPRAEFDSRKIEVKDFKITTKPFNIIIQGDYEKTPKHSFPLFDFKVYLAGYKNLLGVYASELNRYVDKISNTDQLLPIKRVSDEQINTFSGMLKRLSLTDKEDDVLLKLVRDKDSATISGKPFMLVIKQLQALFFANLPGARGFRVPEQEPDNEAGTETTSGIKGERK